MENQQQATTSLCKVCCSFYSSPATDGLCSKCFKGTILTSNFFLSNNDLKEELKAEIVPYSLSTELELLKIETNELEPLKIETKTSEIIPKPKISRCHACKKRVGLMGFVYRCEGVFCAKHRYETEHECNFDYKTVERELIAKNNPIVKADKIERI